MRVGLDFDNTLAGYDHVFRALALGGGLVPEGFRGGKREVREALREGARPAGRSGDRSGASGERAWMALQGQAYGRCMPAAELLPGAADFLALCRERGVELFVVSHKTRTGHFDEARIDLRRAALEWMEAHGFFAPAERGGFALDRARVSFHDTRAAKVAAIAELRLDVFVDDLETVLSDRSFPAGTRRIHYAPVSELSPPAPTGGAAAPWETAGDWGEVARLVFPDAPPAAVDAEEAARRLAPGALRSVERVAGGGNNRIHWVETDRGRFALKTYLRHPADPRDRFGAELAGLSFAAGAAPGAAPRVLAALEEEGALLLEWIDGTAVDPGPEDARAAAGFLGRLARAGRASPGALSELPPASEACPSASELVRQVECRLDRLAAVSCIDDALAGFLADELAPELARERERVAEAYRRRGRDPGEPLEEAARTPSPSDFGFHNALRRSGGGLVFLDFEYFGLDDPVKLVADTLLHPAGGLGGALQRDFLVPITDSFAADGFFLERLQILHRLYALRWCAILLNAFLPERRARLAFADARSGEGALAVQLEKARAMLRSAPLSIR